MKNFIIPLLSLTCLAAKGQQPNFEITGVLKGLGDKKVILANKPPAYSMAYKILKFDSCISKNDTFYFAVRIEYPDFFSIEVEGEERIKSFIIDCNDRIIFQGHVDSLTSAKITGSIEDQLYDSMELKLDPYWIQNNSYVEELSLLKKNNLQNSPKYDSVNFMLNDLSRRRNELLFDFIKSHPDNFVSLNYLYNYQSILKNERDTVIKYYKSFSDRLKESPKGQALYYTLFLKDSVNTPGIQVSDFEIRDSKGELRKLSDYRGKYILLDFWASWCGPCIAQFPHLKEIYKTYDSNDFEIMGISLDIDKAKWLNAIAAHEIPWETFCDEQGADSKPYRIFDASFIPFTVLLDRNANILKINPDMETLKMELENLLKE